jgi:hypothetical protein
VVLLAALVVGLVLLAALYLLAPRLDRATLRAAARAAAG